MRLLTQGRRRAAAVGATMTLLAGFTVVSALQANAAVTTVKASDDTYVKQNDPNAGRGNKQHLEASTDDAVRYIYIKFAVGAQAAGAKTVQLRFRGQESTSATAAVHSVGATNWNETALTWNTKPALGPALGKIGKIKDDRWYSVDVSPIVKSSGVYSFALSVEGKGHVVFDSKEKGHAPELRFDGVTSTGGSTTTTHAPSTTSSSTTSTTAAGDPPFDVTPITLPATTTTAAPNTTTRAPTTTSTPATVPTGTGICRGTAAPATYDHVIWIWMENKAEGDVINNTDAQFENQIANSCGRASNYGDQGIHPSEPNYLNATSGSDWGIRDDNDPTSHPLTTDNLFRQVRNAGKTEKSYMETMPSNCYVTESGAYEVKHNPAAFYIGGNDRAACQQNDVNFNQFYADLDANNLPTFSFITPNECNDMHSCPVTTGDTFFKGLINRVTASNTYAGGKTAVFLVWDEGDTSGKTGADRDHMPFIAIAPQIVPGTVATAPYNHQSLLRTTEEMLGITTYLNGAATATSFRSGFKL